MSFDHGEKRAPHWRGLLRGGAAQPLRTAGVLLVIWVVLAVTVVLNVPPVLRDLLLLLAVTALAAAGLWATMRLLAERDALAARLAVLERRLAGSDGGEPAASAQSEPEEGMAAGSLLDMVDMPPRAEPAHTGPRAGSAGPSPAAAAPFPAGTQSRAAKPRREPKASAPRPEPAPASAGAAKVAPERGAEPAPKRDAAAESAAGPAAPERNVERPRPTAPPALDPDQYIRALDFPETAEDTEGFHALRLALRDPQAAPLVRAGQDVLTLLSEDGIYMEDLGQASVSARLWRSFAEGARGGAVSGLGAVGDGEVVPRVRGRMQSDAVFRDVAQHFLRQFERGLANFAPGAGDDALARFGDTRSARAFRLLGQVAGIFD